MNFFLLGPNLDVTLRNSMPIMNDESEDYEKKNDLSNPLKSGSFFSFSFLGQGESPLSTSASNCPIVPAPDDR
jgi:hypothetical protein